MYTTLVFALALLGTAASAAVPSLPRVSVRQGNGTGSLKYVGVNIAGFDFGCATSGTCTTTSAVPPLTALGGPDGAGQMTHFFNDDKMNIFRLPVAWQWLVNSQLGGKLDATNAGQYDQLMQACLQTGASCIIDIHNYARWNGQIIGQGGLTNDQFTSLWTQLATKYGSNERIIFGLMNEPHEVDITKWAETVQAAVTAIRAVAPTTMILIPGNDYTSAQAFPTNSGPALLNIKNPDGSTTGLVFDVHKYLDSDNSGTHTECVTDNIDSAFAPLATWLRENGRQAMNTETGGGNTASCEQDLCKQVQFLNANSDVFLGVVGWSAGAFDANTYELSEVPTNNGNVWTDSALVKSCLAR